MEYPATPSTPPTPSSLDLEAEVNKLSLNSELQNDQLDQAQVLDEAELEKFRNQWRAEVKAKKTDGVAPDTKGKEVEVGPVRWKSKAASPSTSTTENTHPPTNPKSNLREQEPRPGANYSGGPDKASSPEQFTIRPLPSNKKASTSPSSSKKPLNNALNFKPGQTVDLDKLDSQLTSTTFTPFKPVAVSKAARYIGSIAPDEYGIGGNDKERAISIYTKAVESEQSGKLNEALLLYRKAFKLDDDVDRSYARSIKAKAEAETHRQEQQKHLAVEDRDDFSPSSIDIISPTPPQAEPYSFARHIQIDPDYEKAHPIQSSSSSSKSKNTVSPLSPLTKLFDSLDTPVQNLVFIPEEEELPCPILKLPNELFEPILNRLDVTSIERFGSSCWKARWLTHISHTWRNIAEKIYKPPAMLPPPPPQLQVVGVRDLVIRHRNEWRTTVVEEERIRMDGCYIAVCHYIRPGAGDEWVTVPFAHFVVIAVTYHRFLRFYPDGNVISFLTTDHPSEIVPSLRPSIRGKGLHFGRWRLLRSDSSEFDENPNIVKLPKEEIGGKRSARVIITDLLEPGNASPKYEFEMELLLKSTGRGRWNKLEILEYRSINLLTGEVLALALKHQKPFYFSKVRSYNPPF
uniref:F-box only protein 9 n=1 Tax=Kwoniella pini CBS 10737 TaxID=1296096 RepID=A0A1B9I3A3_9TREE|nr:uncharacterized protein I206_04548 [Kwoniella pini CBS 10737]OCF50017.1 hypothetical protein I206_04548 [Kwoniella pini CBS 10737]